jgi:hypothetical protein
MADHRASSFSLEERSVNNATLFTADGGTHVKIVVVALVASLAVGLVGSRVQ